MKSVLAAVMLLIPSISHADLKVEFNNQVFFLKPGFCITIYRGKTHFCWNIYGFSTIAEQTIAKSISDKFARESCLITTTNCVLYDQKCSEPTK